MNLHFLILFPILFLQIRAEDTGSIFFIDGPNHQFLRAHSAEGVVETSPMSPSDVAAAISVLLGFSPPASLSADSSSKLNEVLSPNPFNRPRAVLMLEVGGIEDQKLLMHHLPNTQIPSAVRSKALFESGKPEFHLPGKDEISVIDMNGSLDSECDAVCVDKHLHDLASLLGGSYISDAPDASNGELTVSLASGKPLTWHMSEKADKEFILQSLQTMLCFLFSIFTISFSFLFLRKKLGCKCDLCQSYLTASWSTQFTNLSDWYTHLLKNSPNSTIHIHVLNNTITANPSNVEYILKTRFDNYPKGKPFSIILGDLLGRGIFNVDGKFWKFQKKMASLELNTISIRSYAFEIVVNEIHTRLIPLLTMVVDKRQRSLDLQDVFRRFTFDNICRFTFGLDPGCLKLSLPISEFADAFDLASQLSAKRALLPSPLIWRIKRFLNMGSEKKLKEAIKLINVLAEEIIRQRRSMMKVEDISNKDLLSRFMMTVHDDDTYLRDIIVSFILAGRDTVASALTSFFWLLTRHPRVETAILNESNQAMGQNHQDVPSFEQLKAMPYLQAALYESMRLYPPVQFDSKFSQEEDVLPDGTSVGKGTRVTYHPYAMGRVQDIWGPDCLEFKPERWLKDGVFTPVSPYKYPVFQAGIRVCLGKEMALVEMKCVVVSLIRRFEFTAAEPNKVLKFAPGLTAGLVGGHQVVVRERKRS